MGFFDGFSWECCGFNGLLSVNAGLQTSHDLLELRRDDLTTLTPSMHNNHPYKQYVFNKGRQTTLFSSTNYSYLSELCSIYHTHLRSTIHIQISNMPYIIQPCLLTDTPSCNPFSQSSDTPDCNISPSCTLRTSSAPLHHLSAYCSFPLPRTGILGIACLTVLAGATTGVGDGVGSELNTGSKGSSFTNELANTGDIAARAQNFLAWFHVFPI